jgi:hypothetical protein
MRTLAKLLALKDKDKGKKEGKPEPSLSDNATV